MLDVVLVIDAWVVGILFGVFVERTVGRFERAGIRSKKNKPDAFVPFVPQMFEAENDMPEPPKQDDKRGFFS